tara:strand:- start:223 stop:1335 length:1113 start_codon:yes stop_codon:yes gene_type:complete
MSRRSDGSYRVLSYNVRAFFDRYTERKPLLHATVRAVGPDVVGLQESMVNGAGLDTDMAAALRGGSADEWTVLQDCATATHVAVCGTPPKYGIVQGFILRFVLTMTFLLLKVPLLGRVVSSMPLALERWRERVGRASARSCCCKLDIYPLGMHGCVCLAPFFGISSLLRPGLIAEAVDRLVLQPTTAKSASAEDHHMGTALRCRVRDAQSGVTLFWFVNLHLVSWTTPAGAATRAEETRRVLAWMKPVLAEANGRCVIVGDHNTLLPDEPLLALFRDAGYASAHLVAKGSEPASTWPSGVKAPFMDLEGINLGVDGVPAGVCLDFIWTCGDITVVDAGIAGNACAPHDPTLYPSDHIGVWAEVRLGSYSL